MGKDTSYQRLNIYGLIVDNNYFKHALMNLVEVMDITLHVEDVYPVVQLILTACHSDEISDGITLYGSQLSLQYIYQVARI